VTPLVEGVGIALDSLRANKVRAALTILGVAIGVMVVMVIGALISGFNKGVSDMLEQSGPKTFWVGRHFQGGVSICDDTDENCPWRRNPSMKVEDARLIRQVASVAFVAVDENAGAGSNVASAPGKPRPGTRAGPAPAGVKSPGAAAIRRPRCRRWRT